jgi:hypothetical protein
MNFSKDLKVFELNILRQAGVSVTPQQVGLKSDPIADLELQNATGSFSNILSSLGGGTQGLVPPVPPTPPSDPTDTAAQAKYQQDLLTYQSNFQVYNQRFMQLMMSQMQALQQSINMSNQQSSSTSSTSSDSSATPTGVGGILDI